MYKKTKLLPYVLLETLINAKIPFLDKKYILREISLAEIKKWCKNVTLAGKGLVNESCEDMSPDEISLGVERLLLSGLWNRGKFHIKEGM